jgi:hypothetical protein
MMMKNIFFLYCMIVGAASAQTLNRQMVMDSVWESAKLNVAYPEKTLIIIHSQVQNLLFDEPNRNLKVEAVGTGDWNVYLTPGTARLKVNAPGFQQLELAPINFKRKQAYEMKISAQGFSSLSRADENLFEVTFDLGQAGVYASYGNLTPVLSKSASIAFKVPKGEYAFRFQKPGFVDETRTLKVTASLQQQVSLRTGAGTASMMKLPGFIVLQSTPSGAEIVVNGQKIGTTPLQFDLVAGSYQLELRKPLFYPDASVFEVKENETKEITRALRSRSGYLTVVCNQPGASVYLDEKPVGTIPFDRRSVESGKHTLRVDQPFYHSASETIVIADGETRSAVVTLKPAFGSLTVASAPEDSADVYIDNIKVGVTPYHTERMASGKYVLRVTKAFFNDVEEDLAIVDETAMTRTVILGRNFGELAVSAPGQTILVNGREVGKDSYRARLAPGKYTLRSERGDAYLPDEKDVFLAIGEPASVTLAAAPRLATVSVVAEPIDARGAEIYVNNELKGKAPTSFPLIIGTHSIVARSANYLDAAQTITVKEGEQKKVTLTLTTYEGSRQSSIDAWGRSKWISAGAAVLAGAAAVYCQSRSDSYYDAYTHAATTEAAQTARDGSQHYSTYTGIAVGAVVAGGVTAIVSWIWQSTF